MHPFSHVPQQCSQPWCSLPPWSLLSPTCSARELNIEKNTNDNTYTKHKPIPSFPLLSDSLSFHHCSASDCYIHYPAASDGAARGGSGECKPAWWPCQANRISVLCYLVFFYGFFLMSDSLADGLVRMETLLKATSQVSDYWTKSRTLPIVFRRAMLYFWSQVFAWKQVYKYINTSIRVN